MTPRREPDASLLPRFSLERRVTVLVLFLSTLVVGAVAALGIPVELVPQGFDNPFLRVQVPYQDSPPKEVLEKITIPLEEELSTVRGLERLDSWSSSGNSMAFLRFKSGTDMDVAYREVRDRVERARRSFPDDVDRVFIRKDDTSGIPVVVFGVAVEPGTPRVYDLVERGIIRRLQRIDGVATVIVNGLEEKEILIELDREKTSAAGLNIYDLAQRLSDDNFTLASGQVYDGDKKLLLRSVAEYETVEQVERLLVSEHVRLRDIATISYEEAEKEYRVRANSKPAFAVIVLKEGDANTREVSERVGEEFVRMQDDPRLAAFGMVEIFDQGSVIDESLNTLLQSGLIGGFIAAFVLFFFLRRFRLMAVVALSIPLSMVMALTVMYFVGETLNLLTLLGLMICVGLLVDNAVVVAENIYRLHREGLAPREAALRGTSEISLAITMSTMTTVIVFLPISLVEGSIRFFLQRLSIPICVSLVASLFVALVFVPLCVYLTLLEPERVSRGRRLVNRINDGVRGMVRFVYENTLGRVSRAYARVLAFFMRRRLDLVLGLALVCAITFGGVGKNVEWFVQVQEDERNGFEIQVEMPDTYTLEDTEEWFLEAEKVVEKHADELGLSGWLVFHGKTSGDVEGWLNNPRTTDLSPREVTERVRDLLPVRPGMKVYTGEESDVDESTGPETYSVVLYGEDVEQLDAVGTSLEELFARVPGVLGAKKQNETAPNELGLRVDRARAEAYQVNPQWIAGIVGYALRGTPLPKYNDDGVEIPVRVRFQEEDRASLTELSSFMVPTGTGSALPLSALTETEMLSSPPGISRREKRVAKRLTFELEEDREKETRERLEALKAGIDLPEGVSFARVTGSTSSEEEMRSALFALILSLVFIYLLMGFLFESFILPLSIMATTGLAVIGVIWAHALARLDVDNLGVVGIVVLIGVVVNNGIVLVDYVGRLRASGLSRREAVALAADRRFRPIMMTAITTIGGMVPLALSGANSIGMSYTSFSLSLIGGMTTATLLTLLVVPVFYTLFDDAREAVTSAMARGRRRPDARAA